MSELLDFERDQLLELLTDALRDGPAGPRWQEAVEAVRRRQAAGAGEGDEYQLLLRAREDLEQGREYRSIRPGPAFTRRVMQQIENEGGGTSGPARAPLAIIILAATALAGIGVLVAWTLLRQPPATPGLAQLQSTTFAQTSLSADLAVAMPPELATFGLTPVVSAEGRGLRPGDPANSQDFRGGGVLVGQALSPDVAASFEVGIQLARASPDVTLQAFVSDSQAFRGVMATSPRELVVNLREGQFGVYLPDGTLAGALVRAVPGRSTLTIRSLRGVVMIDVNGQSLYAGASGLDPELPRYLGVRFLVRGAGRNLDDLTVPVIRLLRP
jgi:hypothetical protein